MNKLNELKANLAACANEERAMLSQRYFKTGPGQYGEGDVFVGITMPEQRRLAKKYADLSLSDVQKLMDSKIHEHRMVGLLILTYQYPKAEPDKQKSIYLFYLINTRKINNWDLVDCSAPNVVGSHLLHQKNRTILIKLAKSDLLWERRIAILSTFAFIKNGESEWSLRIAAVVMNDSEDLIHKAAGWMLREVGKKCGEQVLKSFLDDNAKKMPRTMLRYAIERLDSKERLFYLNLKA